MNPLASHLSRTFQPPAGEGGGYLNETSGVTRGVQAPPEAAWRPSPGFWALVCPPLSLNYWDTSQLSLFPPEPKDATKTFTEKGIYVIPLS